MTDITSSPQGEQTLDEHSDEHRQTATDDAQHPHGHRQSPDAAASGDAARAFPVPGRCGEAFADEASSLEGDEAAEIEEELDELVKIARQRDEYLALAQRTQADFENYRKRVAREAKAAQERGVASLARELLPALDNLDRA
ncbi:MAG TPA: nucleotide exchange factor GrpE, partial [Solirubrobacteraceae bacterium]|nr:nucleotide exchange factor GrpE [Solirubrobacteraceae bacterium]